MVTVATVTENTASRLSFSFALDDGSTVKVGPRGPLQEGEVAQDLADALIPGIEGRAKEEEKEAYIASASAGNDTASFALHFNTKPSLDVILIKRALNLMRDQSDNYDKYNILARIKPVADGYSDAEIAAVTGWTVSTVADARARLDSFADAVANLDHGEAEFEGVE